MGLRILFALPSYAPAASWGGPIESNHRLCQALLDLGADVRVLTTNATNRGETIPYPCDRWVRHEGVPVTYCRRLLLRTVSPCFLTAVRAAVREADVVHVGSIFNFTVPATLGAAVHEGKPFVLTPRGALDPWSLRVRPWLKRFWLTLLRPALNRAVALHATSTLEANGWRPLGLIPPAIVIPNGFDPAPARRADPATGVWRRRLGIKGPLLVMLGRIHPKKGFDVGIATLANVLELHAGARLVIAGPDSDGYLARVEALADERGVRDQICVAGLVAGDEKYQLLAEADVLLLPSHEENFGNVVVEALASGTPVVASHATPWQELDAAGVGRWVERRPETFTAAVLEMLAGDDRDAVRGRCVEWAERHYTWSKVARKMLDVYLQLLEGATPSPIHPPSSTPTAGRTAP